MRTPNCRHVTADTGGVGGHHVHIDAEPVAKHPARVANAAAVIDREPHRDGMDDMAVARLVNQMPLLEHPLHFGIGDLPAGNADFCLHEAIPSSLPTVTNAAIARSTSSVECPADSCTRIRAAPLGTTGYENPIT